MLTLAREHPELDASVVDLGAGDASALARQLLQEMAAPAGETLLAVRGGERLAARLQEIPGEALGLPSPHRRLEIAERGSLQNLRLTPFEPALPGAGEVSIQVRAAGLNFKDVLKALGMVQGDETPLGSECSGIVIATGPGVTGWQVGDEVIALTPGAFASVSERPQRAGGMETGFPGMGGGRDLPGGICHRGLRLANGCAGEGGGARADPFGCRRRGPGSGADRHARRRRSLCDRRQ